MKRYFAATLLVPALLAGCGGNYQITRAGDVPATAADTAELEAWVGFKPNTSVQEGVAGFVAWYRGFYGV